MIIAGNERQKEVRYGELDYPCILSADHFNRSISADENVHD